MGKQSQVSFLKGMKTGFPLIFSAVFFGIAFGYTGASGGLPLIFISSMSIIIFAGSAQFITLVLIIDNQLWVGILIAAIILNLRHLIYGAILNEILTLSKIKKSLIAYFLTDESFLVTIKVHKDSKFSDIKYIPDFVLLGSGIFLWISWNIATITGYFLYNITSSLIILPDNFIIAASFLGFFVEQYVKFPQDRGLMVFLGILSLSLGTLISLSNLLIIVIIMGSLIAMIAEFLNSRRQ